MVLTMMRTLMTVKLISDDDNADEDDDEDADDDRACKNLRTSHTK